MFSSKTGRSDDWGRWTAARCGMAAAAALAALSLTVLVPGAHAQAVSKIEQKCSKGLGKTAAKLSKLAAKGIAKCREADIAGPSPVSCPDSKTLAKIAKFEAKMQKIAEKKCGSVCSVSTAISCLSDDQCPPVNSAPEKCSAGVAGKPFDMGSIGFPGPFCESALGHTLETKDDLADCVSILTEDSTDNLMDVLYGSLGTASVSPSAGSCLSAVSKTVQKLVALTVKGVTKCHDGINKGASGNPATCASDDKKLLQKIIKFEGKVRSTVEKSCSPDDILELDLCLNGVGGTTSVSDAADCLVAAGREIADSNVAPVEREYSSISIVDAGYPPPTRCGDNEVNQTPNGQLLLGEECDGDDDAACPGECLPPGDIFECTCGNIPRVRFYADASRTESDAGWTGDSHEQTVADLTGWINALSNCNCSQFTDATCTGTTSDSVCDATGYQLPTCTWDLFSGTRCDQHGNHDNTDEDLDCQICDSYSANAGNFCVNENDCASQCYPNAGGSPTGSCTSQADCASGETCRGRCDKSPKCFIVPNGAPLPVSQGGAQVCAVQRYRTDVVGTRDIVTGQHELNWRVYSIIHTGENNRRPCPVCGGFCVGGPKGVADDICLGRCSQSGDKCMFDADCAGVDDGEFCSTDSPDCPGGFCQLAQVCGSTSSGSPGRGGPCTIDYVHPVFGNMSNDCLPDPGANITGAGFKIDVMPATDHAISLPSTLHCTSSGYELLDCPCPDAGGAPTQPNGCAPACNAGAELGMGCATGNGSGIGTTCDGGPNAGDLCDEDSDCNQVCSIADLTKPHVQCTSNADCAPSHGSCVANASACDANPTHCIGDPAFQQFSCSTNADCGAGTCVDACPSGRCVPLCVPDVPDDPTDGVCAAGPPLYHCRGPQLQFLSCAKSAADAVCSATCSVSGTACEGIDDCPEGETCEGSCPRAKGCEAGLDGVLGTADDELNSGPCIAGTHSCYLDGLASEGGSTLNGLGDPTNYFTTYHWCFGKTTTPAIDTVAGFGGPGLVRMHGTNVMNTDSIP